MRTEMAVLEGVFIFAATMVLSRIIHSFLEFTFVNQPIPEIKSNEEEKLLTYAKPFGYIRADECGTYQFLGRGNGQDAK